MLYPPPTISCGKHDKKVLHYLLSHQNTRFNIKRFCRQKKLPRSSIYSTIKRLKKHGLITIISGNTNITDKGKQYLNHLYKGKGKADLGKVCPMDTSQGNLSTHFHKFKLRYSNTTRINPNYLKRLNPLDIKSYKVGNIFERILFFEDCNIRLGKNQVIINLYDILTNNVDEADSISFQKVLKYIKLLEKAGIYVTGTWQESGHWARVNSVLAKYLYEIDENYYLDLGNGRKFWIDHSLGKLEDETNDKEVRKRLDNFMGNITRSKDLFKEIQDLKEIVKSLAKIETVRSYLSLPPENNHKEDLGDRPNYIG